MVQTVKKKKIALKDYLKSIYKEQKYTVFYRKHTIKYKTVAEEKKDIYRYTPYSIETVKLTWQFLNYSR